MNQEKLISDGLTGAYVVQSKWTNWSDR